MKKVNKVDGFVYTTAIKKLRKLKKRKRVVPGGSSAGKTFGILPILIDIATKKRVEISIVSESIPHLRRGAMKDFLKVMRNTGRYINENWGRHLLTYTFSNGSTIEFFSVENESKVLGARRDILYINECNNIKFETFHQLAIRTNDHIWLDFNPACEFWAHTELANDPSAEWLTLTYKDNEALNENIINELELARDKGFYNTDLPTEQLFKEKNIKSDYWANWWKVYGLGLTGTIEGVILTDWEQIKAIPLGAEYLGSGTDFGKGGNDPTTTINFYWYDGKVIWDEVIYETQLRDSDHIKKLKEANVSQKLKMFCDNSEPSKIRELQLGGFLAVGEKKETIDYGLGLIKESPFLVTTRSVNVISELRKYMYGDNGSPMDRNNHTIDAARYFYVGKFGVNKKTKTGISKLF